MFHSEILWRAPFTVFVVVVLCFAGTGPILFVRALVLMSRSRTERLGLLTLMSGAVGFLCVIAVIGSISRQSVVSLIIFGLGGFTTFALLAMMIYHRKRIGLTKR